MELKIISFNIRCCDDKNGNSIVERAPRLAKITKNYDADIIGTRNQRNDEIQQTCFIASQGMIWLCMRII